MKFKLILTLLLILFLSFFFLNNKVESNTTSIYSKEVFLKDSLTELNLRDYPNLSAFAFEYNKNLNLKFSFDNSIFQDVLVFDEHDEYASDIIKSRLYNPNNFEKLYIKKTGNLEAKIILIIDSTTSIPQSSTKAYYDGATNIVSRNEWGANESLMIWEPSYFKVDHFIVHHTAWEGNPTDYSEVVRAIYYYHAVTNGWGDIGYNYLIDPNGVIYEGRIGGESVVGAHAYGQNASSIGIALIGNHDSYPPSEAAVNSLKALLLEKSLLHGVELSWTTNRTVFGHKDIPENLTNCPGTHLYSALPGIISDTETLRLSQLGGEIDAKRTQVISETNGYLNNELKLIFSNNEITQNELNSFLADFGGIISVETDSNQAIIEIYSETYYWQRWNNNTTDHLKLLYLLFLLSPEIQDIKLIPEGTHDFGDAPDSYKTSLGNNGARHLKGSLKLGTKIDGESKAYFNDSATYDDIKNSGTVINDEDGIIFGHSVLQKGEETTIDVTASGFGYLNAWADFNIDGDFDDEDEKIFNAEAIAPGVNKLNFLIPFSAQTGFSFIRFRLSEEQNLDYFGESLTGEVEDYKIETTNWSEFVASNSESPHPIASAIFNNKLYQAQVSSNGAIFIRSSYDGKFDQTYDDQTAPIENWQQISGGSLTAPELAVFNNGQEERLYLSVVGRSSNQIFTRSMNEDGFWNEWQSFTGSTLQSISMTSYFRQDLNKNALYQFIKGARSNKIYMRLTFDGIYDGIDQTNSDSVANFENWRAMDVGSTPLAPKAITFQGKMYLSVVGNSYRIFHRYSEDGLTWSEWFVSDGSTYNTIDTAIIDNNLYQIVVGKSQRLFKRNINENFLSDWEVDSTQPPLKGSSTIDFNNQVFQFVTSIDNNLHYRFSHNFSN